MQTVTLAFYKAPGNFQDKFIRYVTCAPYSHMELLNDSVVQSSNLCISASKRDGKKVREKTIEWNYGHWDFLLVKVDNRKKIIDRAYSRLGEKYSMLGAALSVTPFGFARDGYCFCSELMAYAFEFDSPFAHHPGEVFNRLKSYAQSRVFNGV